MIIKELQLRNFRNIDFCSIQLHENYNVFLGMNAQGKTNVLESLFFLSSTRSHRTLDDQQCIQFGKECSNLDCVIQDEKEKRLSAVIHQKGKTLLMNKNPISKSSEFIGKLNVVLFSPSDLTLFEDSPKDRRRIVDVEIGKVSPQYMNHLSKYLKLLKERNSLLKMNRYDDSYMSVLEEQMIQEEIEILKLRKQFSDEINTTLSIYYKKLSHHELKVQCLYESCIEITSEEKMKESLIQLFKKNKEKDLYLKSTSTGIHRDDFVFELDGKQVENFASQGQKRLVILGLKLSILHYIKKMTKQIPVLLLDDVMSELDQEKRKSLFQAIPKGVQTIITTTDLEELKKEIQGFVRVFEVKKGVITKKEDSNDDRK